MSGRKIDPTYATVKELKTSLKSYNKKAYVTISDKKRIELVKAVMNKNLTVNRTNKTPSKQGKKTKDRTPSTQQRFAEDVRKAGKKVPDFKQKKEPDITPAMDIIEQLKQRSSKV